MKEVETETKNRTIPWPAYMSRVVSGYMCDVKSVTRRLSWCSVVASLSDGVRAQASVGWGLQRSFKWTAYNIYGTVANVKGILCRQRAISCKINLMKAARLAHSNQDPQILPSQS